MSPAPGAPAAEMGASGGDGSGRAGGFAAISVVFAVNAMAIAAWLPRIPDVKDRLALDAATLGLCLFALPLGALLLFPLAPRIISRFGLRATVAVTGGAFALAFIGPAFAWSAPSLFAALFAAGLAVGPIEVAMNAKAAEMERLQSRRIMARCHGFWSFGTILGAGLAAAASLAGLSFGAQQLLLMPPLALAAWCAARATPMDGAREGAPPPVFAFPRRAATAFCILPLGAMIVEAAMMDWSAVFARETLGAPAGRDAALFGAFALAMTLSRLAGDALAARFGAARVIVASSCLAMAGMAGVAAAPGLIAAALAAVAAGAGVGNVYPLGVSAAAEAGGEHGERDVASVAFISFFVILAAPPVIGVLADAWSLRTAFAILAPTALLAVLMVALTPRLRGAARRP